MINNKTTLDVSNKKLHFDSALTLLGTVPLVPNLGVILFSTTVGNVNHWKKWIHMNKSLKWYQF